MRHIARFASVTLMTLALSAVAASAAFASTPEFLGTTPDSLTNTSGTTFLREVGSSTPFMRCTKDKGYGDIGSFGLVEVVLTVEGCTSLVHCPSTANFETLGELGAVAATEATSEVGLLVKLEGAFTCNGTEATIIGNVAGEVETVGTSSTSNRLVFATINSNTEQKIQKIGSITPSLLVTLAGVHHHVTLETTETISLTNAIEVMP